MSETKEEMTPAELEEAIDDVDARVDGFMGRLGDVEERMDDIETAGKAKTAAALSSDVTNAIRYLKEQREEMKASRERFEAAVLERLESLEAARFIKEPLYDPADVAFTKGDTK